MVSDLQVPRVDVSAMVSGTLRIALDCGLVYQVDLIEAMGGSPYNESLARQIERYYEPLTATLVQEGLRDWHDRLAAMLIEVFSDALRGARFDCSVALDRACGPLWVEE